MEFKDVCEVINAGSATSANDLLDKGWTLLAVVAGEKTPNFVLGRAKGSDPLVGKKNALAGLTAGAIARTNNL